MKQYKVDVPYMGYDTTLDLRRVVAISKPKNKKFLIYFENAVWTIPDTEFDRVYNAWMGL